MSLRKPVMGTSVRLGAALILMALVLAPFQVLAQSGMEVVAEGLNNPRGLAFDHKGALYVAEAGAGGENCFPADPADPESQVCIGATGSVTRVWRGSQVRLATNLPSLAGPDGSFAIGPVDISFQGKGSGFIVIGLGADPALRDQLAATVDPLMASFGQLAVMTPQGKWRLTTDLAAFEARANPDGGAVDSNPYAVQAFPSKRLIVDAGGNDLLAVNNKNKIVALASFPDRMADAPPFLGLPPGTQIPMQSVPTTAVVGKDGNIYVGELTGFPFPVGGARIYRVPGNGGQPEVFAEGFTAIIDIAFGRDGSLYVLEMFKNGVLAGEFSGDLTGALIKIAPDGTRTEIASDGLVAPGGVAVGPDGALYVTNYSVFPGMGQVVRISGASASFAPDMNNHKPNMRGLPKGQFGIFDFATPQVNP